MARQAGATMIKTLIKIITIACVLGLFHSMAHADDVSLDVGALHLNEPCAPEVEVQRRAILDYNGIKGIWFQYNVSLCMLDRLAMLPKLTERLVLLEDRKAADDKLIAAQDEINKVSIQARVEAESVLNKAIQGRKEAEDKLDSWARSPLLWIGVGVGSTVILLISGAVFLNAVL